MCWNLPQLKFGSFFGIQRLSYGKKYCVKIIGKYEDIGEINMWMILSVNGVLMTLESNSSSNPQIHRNVNMLLHKLSVIKLSDTGKCIKHKSIYYLVERL